MDNNALKLYELYLNQIKETDEISFKLMGLVPLLSGAGIFTLLTQNSIKVNDTQIPIPQGVFWITGIFGALITYCIYRWELRNIQICKVYRGEAKKIEENNTFQVGVFRNFPTPPCIIIRKSKRKAPVNECQKKTGDIKIAIGKTEAEKGIYLLTILFWLLMPIIKTII